VNITARGPISPLGANFTPRGEVHPWGPGVKLRMSLCLREQRNVVARRATQSGLILTLVARHRVTHRVHKWAFRNLHFCRKSVGHIFLPATIKFNTSPAAAAAAAATSATSSARATPTSTRATPSARTRPSARTWSCSRPSTETTDT
jgi:hypothetical protein